MNVLSEEKLEDTIDMLGNRYETWCNECIFFKTEDCPYEMDVPPYSNHTTEAETEEGSQRQR